MSKKRKTREQKIKTAERIERKITYSYTAEKIVSKKALPEVKIISEITGQTSKNDVRKILLTSAAIIIINLALFFSLTSGGLKLNFLGY